MDKLLDTLPDEIQTLVRGKAKGAKTTLGKSIGAVIDAAIADGWKYDKRHDEFVKGNESIMVKQVWRALVEEKGA